VSQHARLVEALLGNDPRLLTAYHHDAEFHAAIEIMARTLPPFVQLMADQASVNGVARRLAHYDEP
jgi:hypothetical protein